MRGTGTRIRCMASQLTLFIGRAGTGKTERLLDEYRLALREARERGQLGDALWLAPTRRAQQAIIERLLSSDDPVQLAPQVMTFEVFAEKILAAAGRPASPISPVMKRLLLRRIVAELAAGGMLDSFASVVSTSGFLDVVSAFISELKQEEIWPEDFLAVCARRLGSRSQRDAELGRIYERYQTHLTEQNWYDNEGRFWLARTALAEGVRGPFAAVEFLAVDGFADFTQTQYEILGHLMGWIRRATITLPLEQPTTRSDLFAKPNTAQQRLRDHLSEQTTVRIESLAPKKTIGQPGLRCMADSLFANPRTLQPDDDASGVEVIAATGPIGEWQAVARRIKQRLEAGVAPKDIVVAMRSLAEDGAPWSDALREAGIPVWCEAKSPLTASPIVKALFSMLQLELEGWPFARLMTVLDSNLFQPHWPEMQHGRAVRSVVATLRRLKLHAGRDLMLRVLSRVASGLIQADAEAVTDEDDTPPPESESTAAALAALAEPLLARLSRATERLRRRHTLAGWADTLAALGGELGWSRGGIAGDAPSVSQEAREWDLLQRIVRTAAEADEKLIAPPGSKPSRKLPTLDLAEFTAELRDLLGGETIPPSADPGGCVRVLDVEQARHLTVPHLFVVGLSESSFPQNRADDCLFGESERRDFAARGLRLRHREQHHQDETFLFYNLVTKARASLTLSYPAINRKGQPVFPSPYVTAVRSLFTPAALPIVQEGQLDPVPNVDQALTATDLRLVAMTEARAARPGLFSHLLAQPEWQRVGLNVLASVDMNAHRFHTRGFTSYEGRLELPQNLESLRKRFGAQHQFSATELEGYATCPFRFWLGKVLKLDALPTPEEGTDYAARGSLIHDVLAKLLVEGMASDVEPLAARFRQLVEEKLAARFHETELQRALTRIEGELLGQWGDAFAKQHAEYRDKLNSAWTGHIPSLAPEIPFGSLPDAEPVEAEPQHEPIVFGADDQAVRVRGRIDRVDVGTVAGQTVFTVIDYKTGRPPKSNEAELQTGRAIQLALYALAVRRLGLAGPDAVPFQMGYWLLKETGFKRGYQRESKSFDGLDAAAIDSLEQILDDVIPKLAEGLRSGKFLVENADRDCTGHCPYHTTCRVNQIRPLAESLHKIGDILI